jgi:ABC-type thiamin/hydroxymethylpyrimidine transport system permease subunit
MKVADIVIVVLLAIFFGGLIFFEDIYKWL